VNNILIKGGRVIIPSRGLDETVDILIKGERIASISKDIDPGKTKPRTGVVDADGLWVVPGLVDIHTHLRVPGYEYKETISSGTAAAAAGGFTSILCMPNTDPVNDNAAVTRYILKKVQEEGRVKVYPVGAVTVGLSGQALSEIVDMSKNGCVAFSDDGRSIMNSLLCRKALEYLKYPDKPLISHAEDNHLADGGVCHEGPVACALGLKGIPSEAEEVMVARDIALARMTGGRIHFAHLSSRGSVRLVAEAREEGLPVTSEVTPHHLFLTEEAVRNFDTDTKVNPPLREENDRKALTTGLVDGVIDCIASDHAPHGLVDKEVEYDLAAFGISGLETSLPLCMKLVHQGILTPLGLVERMSSRPAEIMGLEAGELGEGGAADVALIDPDLQFMVDTEDWLSRGKNTPFGGWPLAGRAVLTLVDGRVVHSHSSMSARLQGLKIP
jgi:dihydroorotase